MYGLCFMSLLWAVVVFFGAPFFTWAILKYSDGQLIPSQVRVSPKLDILAEKLDYEFKETKDESSGNAFITNLKVTESEVS